MILAVILLSVIYTNNLASGGALGPRSEPNWENGRFLYVTALDGQRHLIDRLAEPVAHEVFPSDVTFHLYTRQGDADTPFNMADFNGDLDATGFDSTLPTFFFMHGWTVNHNNYLELPGEIMDADKGIAANVFLVDYRRVAKFFYTYAVGSLPAVGEIIADGVKTIMERYGMQHDQINIMGHSLGGQLTGFVGASLGGLANQIISLDPAGPLFQDKDIAVRLDPSDAQYVQVIHTNGGLLGYVGSTGHSDYFPNSGRMVQPNCGSDLVGFCAHRRAIAYYRESLHSTGFVGTQCETWEEYLSGSCDGNEKSSMGMIFSNKEAIGDYYLETASESPFALG